MGQKMSSRYGPCSHTLLFCNTSVNNGCPCLRLQEDGQRKGSVGFHSLHFHSTVLLGRAQIRKEILMTANLTQARWRSDFYRGGQRAPPPIAPHSFTASPAAFSGVAAGRPGRDPGDPHW